jgi:hypothetical protein
VVKSVLKGLHRFSSKPLADGNARVPKHWRQDVHWPGDDVLALLVEVAHMPAVVKLRRLPKRQRN